MVDMILKLNECLRAASEHNDDSSIVIEIAIEAALKTTPEGGERLKLKRTRLRYKTIFGAVRGEDVGMMQIMAALSKKEQKLTYPLQSMLKEITGKV